MTGAGAATVAFAKEPEFKEDPTDGEYWKFGRDATVTELDLERALTELTEGDKAEYVESVAGNLEGAFAIEAAISSDVHGDVEDLVFNDGGTGFEAGRAASGRIYTGVDYLDGTAERELIGAVPLEYTVSYEQGEPVSYTLSMAYADEELNTSITPSSINGVSDGTTAMYHGVTLDIDGTEVAKLQEAALSISNISRFQWGASHTAIDAVLARPEEQLEVDAILTGPSRTELAYGGTDATETAARMDSVSGSLNIAIAGESVSTYEMPKLKPNQNSWNDVITDGDTDTTDSTTFNVNGGIEVSD
ncbi:hypothetical protein RBH26_20580 [Natronolimnohabitans sp. A-GB9]|uniref:hypothetical protein n=1 Tax=Natronolimnohabitans sp. A-GB9 TaxID=3069757 RepID=UPI0027B863A8|nr:hypothetical protein [Natronolimnohabitans sp. A-GB9]MDQ2052841.1 hypothetical protein [Natronolimnohabitans sp. A-GB9]